MSKIHVLPDENLGGVLREFREVDRAANVGDKIVIVDPSDFKFGDNYTKGTVMTVTEVDEDGDVYCEKFDLIDKNEYQTLEPTDIVHIDDVRYRLVDRKAKVGEKVIIVKGEGWYENKIGNIYEVIDGKEYGFTEVELDDGDVYVEVAGNEYKTTIAFISASNYRVLKPIEPAEECDNESEASKSVLDLLANLARRVTELEQKLGGYARKIDGIEIDIQNINIDLGAVDETATELDQKINRLGNANEQAITAVARDVETLAQELEEVKQRSKNETITITLDSQAVSKLITEVLLSAQINQNRINR